MRMEEEEEEVERRGILWIFEVHVSFLRRLCVLSDLSVLLCTLQEKGDVGLKEEQTQYVYTEPPLQQQRYFLYHIHCTSIHFVSTCSSGLKLIPRSSVAVPYLISSCPIPIPGSSVAVP